MTARGALNAAITGVLFAWLVLILMAFHQPKIYDVRIFGVAMLFGALFAVIVRAVISLTSPPGSRARADGQEDETSGDSARTL